MQLASRPEWFPDPSRLQEGSTVRLRDGSAVIVRPIRPDDAPTYLAAFEHLGPTSRYRRFLSPKPRLSEAEVRYFTAVDHRDHEALVALDPVLHHGVGVARWIRDPTDPLTADVAVTVVDEWQGRGLGPQLLRRLGRSAAAHGVRRLRAEVLADNRPMLSVLRREWPRRQTAHVGGGVVQVTVPLD